MNRFPSVRRIAAAVAVLAGVAIPMPAPADPIIKIQGRGTLTLDADGLAVLRLAGAASELGRYVCYGEVAFELDDEDGSLDGTGPVAFTAADGDRLVGIVSWHIDPDGTGQATFRWRDDVTFADGTVVLSTGRFADRRPPGAVVATIINEGAVATFR
jgi:hypothetical protein